MPTNHRLFHVAFPVPVPADCAIARMLFARYAPIEAKLILLDTPMAVFEAIERCFEASLDTFISSDDERRNRFVADLALLHKPAFIIRFLAAAAAKQAKEQGE